MRILIQFFTWCWYYYRLSPAQKVTCYNLHYRK